MRPLSLALLFALGCSTAMPHADQSLRFTPPTEYHQWHDSLARCTGRHASFGQIRWFILPDTTLDAAKKHPEFAVGLWGLHVAPHDIYIRSDRLRSMTVPHELLHNLGLFDHDDPLFKRCLTKISKSASLGSWTHGHPSSAGTDSTSTLPSTNGSTKPPPSASPSTSMSLATSILRGYELNYLMSWP